MSESENSNADGALHRDAASICSWVAHYVVNYSSSPHRDTKIPKVTDNMPAREQSERWPVTNWPPIFLTDHGVGAWQQLHLASFLTHA